MFLISIVVNGVFSVANCSVDNLGRLISWRNDSMS